MMSGKYGVALVEEPIFLTWGDANGVVSGLWPEARNVWLLCSMLALPAAAVLTLAIQAQLKALSLALQEVEGSRQGKRLV